MLAAAPSGAAALGSNENPLGPSPRGVEAWLRAARCLHRYPDVVPAALCEAIASKHELDAARIECTHGAEQAIELIVRALVPPGDNVVAPALTFKMVEVAVRWAGAEYIAADLDGWAPDVDAVLAAVTERTRLVAVAAPNNPTGQTLDTADLLRLRQELPEQIPLVLDQAYAELDAASVHETGLKLCRDGANTVVVRTFSKAYGLAGARVGWFSGHTTVVERVRGLRCPFHLGRADAAAARAALDDDTHVAATVLHCDTWRARFREAIEAAGLQVIGAAANFVAFTCPAGPKAAARLHQSLLDGGVFVRPLAMYGLHDALRVSVGAPDENLRFMELLSDHA